MDSLRRRRVTSAALLLALAASSGLAACGGSAPSEPPPEPTAAEPTAAEPSEDAAFGPPPPVVLLLGDDQLPGEVGSYAWPGGAESAPWLVAAALEGFDALAGERVRAASAGPAIATWTAVAAPADDPDPERPQLLNEGAGPPEFALPSRPGRWVVSLRVVYEGEQGDAAWYWYVVLE